MRLASSKTEAVRQGFLNDVRRLATRLMGGLARTRVTPNALTAAGVSLSIGGSVFAYFSYRHELAFFWAAAGLFVAGSLLDILDGALARASGKVSPFGAFIDSTTDRVSEAFMLGAIALVFARGHALFSVGLTIAAILGSFLVSYTRARAEMLGLRGDVGLGDRATRVVVITAGLVLAPWGVLPWAIGVLTALAWYTVILRALFVRSQLLQGGK
ncbi:MAG TPA: CDP-alcohol phosphatidyltransferase family protein [Gaiellaceae bacterium]